MEFKFHCPHCERRLAFGEELIGRTVQCPDCDGAIQVPAPASRVQPIFTASTSSAPEPETSPKRETKACPYCAEEILAKAKKCKHCGEMLYASRKTQQQEQPTSSQAVGDEGGRSGFLSWVLGAFKRKKIVRSNASGTFNIKVKGSSHYQSELSKICGGRTEEGHDVKIDAFLFYEDGNSFDPQAIRVEISGHTVGYLSRQILSQYRGYMTKSGLDGVTVACSANIRGGWDRGDGDAGFFGIRLDLPFMDET
jgi:DNA-directed RNA polymerase subunit RPC12/RpoP